MKLLYFKADNLIELLGLRRADDETVFLNAATVTAQIKDTSGTNIGGSITMAYVAASNGNYRGTIDDTIAVTEDTEVRAEVSANAGAGLQGFWNVPLHVVVQEN